MDDFQNLTTAKAMKSARSPLHFFIDVVWQDTMGPGRFRPVYSLWVVTMYPLFEHMPTVLYVLMALLNMGALIVWGLVFYEFFSVQRKYFFITVFLFPLSFFIFTPFWNNFMYISLQDKFVILFGGLSLYFFKKSYDHLKKRHIIYTLLFTILAIFGKATAIYLPLIYILYGFYNGIARFEKKISFLHMWVNGFLAGLYIWFTFQVQLKGSYSSLYGSNLKAGILKGKIIESSLLVKFLFLMALGICLYGAVNSFLRRKPLGFPVLLPMGLLMYLATLLPWGFYAYQLCALAPLVLAAFFPFYLYVQKRNVLSASLGNGVLILSLLIVFIGIIVPRISEMSDIGKVVEFIRKSSSQNNKYFLPVYKEWAFTLSGFTGAEVVYFDRERLQQSALDPQKSNFLLLNHLCPQATLVNISPQGQVFSNDNWKVVALSVKNGHLENFTADFPQNMVQKIKNLVRDFLQ